MIFRPLQNSDLNVAKGFAARNGDVRVYVSLKKASFVNKLFWIHPRDMEKPETIAQVRADMQALLETKAKCLEHYLTP